MGSLSFPKSDTALGVPFTGLRPLDLAAISLIFFALRFELDRSAETCFLFGIF